MRLSTASFRRLARLSFHRAAPLSSTHARTGPRHFQDAAGLCRAHSDAGLPAHQLTAAGRAVRPTPCQRGRAAGPPCCRRVAGQAAGVGRFRGA